jgi:hypothetical protein
MKPTSKQPKGFIASGINLFPHLFEQREMSGRKGGKVTKKGCRRTPAGFASILGVLVFVLLLASVTLPPAGYAAFPGANGKIAFSTDRDGNWEIYVVNPDGTNPINLTSR